MWTDRSVRAQTARTGHTMTAGLSGASLRLLVRRRAELPREPECGLQHAVHLVRVRVRVRVRVGVGVGLGLGLELWGWG